jgi:O-antigen/teichoic acid export membrane protein
MTMMTLTAAPPAAHNNTKTVGRNFMFMGLEVVITLVVTLLTTVFIARLIGPTRLGYFNLIYWLTSITCSVGSLGIPLSTFKYLGEFLGSGKRELARAVFVYNLLAQTAIASTLAATALIAVLILVDPKYRLCSALLVLSIVPNMVTFVPSQANTAAESSIHNTRGAFVRAVIYVVAVTLSLLYGWDLVGIAAGLLLACSAELIVKIVPVLRSMADVSHIPLPAEIRKRMFAFSGLSTGLMLLEIVVWDRSDIICLKLLHPDIRQVAFFSVCFSVVGKLVLPAQALANALSATQMAEYSRNKANLFRMTSRAFVYVLMGTLPVLIGVACIAGPLVRVVYGSEYQPAIPVFTLIALFSIPKATLTPGSTLLYSAEDLGFILKWGCIAGLANVVLDLLLIPHYGATGAALANGIAQTFAGATICGRVLRRYPVRVDFSVLLRLGAATLAMAIVTLGVMAMPLSAVFKLIVGIPTGSLVFLIMSRVFVVLQTDDRRRLQMLSSLVPLPARHAYDWLVDFVVPTSPIDEVSG